MSFFRFTILMGLMAILSCNFFTMTGLVQAPSVVKNVLFAWILPFLGFSVFLRAEFVVESGSRNPREVEIDREYWRSFAAFLIGSIIAITLSILLAHGIIAAVEMWASFTPSFKGISALMVLGISLGLCEEYLAIALD